MISECVGTQVSRRQQDRTFWQSIKNVAGKVPEKIVVILVTILVVVLDLKQTIIKIPKNS